jgi:hypothetical protein
MRRSSSKFSAAPDATEAQGKRPNRIAREDHFDLGSPKIRFGAGRQGWVGAALAMMQVKAIFPSCCGDGKYRNDRPKMVAPA